MYIRFKLRLLALLLSSAYAAHPPASAQAENHAERDDQSSVNVNGQKPDKAHSLNAARKTGRVSALDDIVVTGTRSIDEKGHDDVYEKDIANAYVDRAYLERHKGVSVGDVFAGMNGVYNTDNRNGAALFPNIRGLSGNGRIPVTVDGVDQSLDVWMAMRGINNRNYVDPNMFRNISVEKGPAITRGMKGGIGGSVAIRTIEASDIISPGNNWGMEIKLNTATNSVQDSSDPYSIVGKDYRDIPGAITATTWATPGVAFTEPWVQMRERSDVQRFNHHNRRAFLSGAYRHEYFDAMLAYSNARRGNYFAGTKGADDYLSNTAPIVDFMPQNLYPNLARLFAPGYEVPYTSTHNSSTLFKNNWHLPNGQKLSLGMSRNQLDFGELPPALVELFLNMSDLDPDINFARTRFQYPYPPTQVDQKTYRLNYEIKPQDTRWLDLQFSLWRAVSNNKRYHTGDATYQVGATDLLWDTWVFCKTIQRIQCQGLYGMGTIDPVHPPPRQPNTDNQYNVFIGTLQHTQSTKTGIDVSNRFRLNDRLTLTAAADWQYERKTDYMPIETAVIGGGITGTAFGPASGRRQEYGAGMNLSWRATDRLQISAGTRYGAYWGFDDETNNRLAKEDKRWAKRSINTHQLIHYSQIVSDEELAMHKKLFTAIQDEEWVKLAEEYLAYMEANHFHSMQRDYKTGLQWWFVRWPVPLHDGKADRKQNPFHNGQINLSETVENPQGVPGVYKKHRSLGGIPHRFKSIKPDDPWERPEKQRSHAWTSQLTVSYQLNERARIYTRAASMARFPSILETANRRSIVGEFPYTPRPEHNEAWEIGYVHDLNNLLPHLRVADIKLSYYHNTIRNFYDRTESMTTLQFDRKIMSGLEMQSRFDAGLFYGGLAATLRLRQDMCDADYAVQLDPARGRWPKCVPGGFAGTMAFYSLQPKYSINADLGTRLLQNKMDINVRMRYHSRTENNRLERIVMRDADRDLYLWSTRPFYWNNVMLFDLSAEYCINRFSSVRLSIDNLTDRYYLDPLARVAQPGPGRTVNLDLALRY
ncbi:hypothetical protein ERD78_17155 [Allopusillimonas soli]|uniref:TonB-dependent receptor n=1 Tax=Allopusillimonas soli TaxID=659016 RepID=A0A853FEX3_9BURK|nr:TonB-dependent receptor [Allopusillimonas soli]NYT38603.1 TonB-dependent receptor [Allopusillimonas soli]TEA71683.1 hypothetical protein ERD78_17155 [Allopusillimonas soli]